MLWNVIKKSSYCIDGKLISSEISILVEEEWFFSILIHIKSCNLNKIWRNANQSFPIMVGVSVMMIIRILCCVGFEYKIMLNGWIYWWLQQYKNISPNEYSAQLFLEVWVFYSHFPEQRVWVYWLVTIMILYINNNL